MKKFLFLILAFTLLFSANAASDFNVTDVSISRSIEKILKEQDVFFKDADLNGEITIKFVLDNQNNITVIDVNSSNVYLENHALQALNGHQLISGDAQANIIYQIKIHFIYII